jgi:hypothetical protein
MQSSKIFQTKEQAERYLESYQTRINGRLNVYGKQITASLNKKLLLKVFNDDEKAATSNK